MVASLKHGVIISKNQLMAITVATFIFAFIPLFTAFVSIISFLNNDINMGIAMIISSLVMFLILIMLIFAIIRDIKLKRKIKHWLKDAVVVRAKSKTIDTVSYLFQSIYYKIEVSFVIENVKYNKVSGTKGKFAYHKIFGPYSNKEINILYSRKYDEVLILK